MYHIRILHAHKKEAGHYFMFQAWFECFDKAEPT